MSPNVREEMETIQLHHCAIHSHAAHSLSSMNSASGKHRWGQQAAQQQPQYSATKSTTWLLCFLRTGYGASVTEQPKKIGSASGICHTMLQGDLLAQANRSDPQSSRLLAFSRSFLTLRGVLGRYCVFFRFQSCSGLVRSHHCCVRPHRRTDASRSGTSTTEKRRCSCCRGFSLDLPM